MRSHTAWLASYPKSGNTWVRALLDALQRGTGPSLARLDPLGQGDSMDPALGVPVGELSDAERATMLRTSWAVGSSPHTAYVRRKTHNAWVAADDGYPIPWQPAGAKAIYIVRDPRAVAVSWAHHLGVSTQDAVDLMAHGSPDDVRLGPTSRDVLTTWSGHVRSWLHDCDLPVLLIRYESMIKRPDIELTRMAEFLDVRHTVDDIQRAVDACSFTTLAAREIVEGFAEASAPGRAFFRRGEADSWRYELEPQLGDRICRDHGAVMEELGYQRD